MSDETSTLWGKLLVYQTPLVSAGLSGNPRVGEPRVKEFREEYESISRDVVSLIQENQKSLAHRLETLVDIVDHDLTTEMAYPRDNKGDTDRESYTGESPPTVFEDSLTYSDPAPTALRPSKAIGTQGRESKPRRGSFHIWDDTGESATCACSPAE